MNLQTATLEARRKTGDKSISVRVDAGRLQVVSVTYKNGGSSNVKPLSKWMPMDGVIAFLNSFHDKDGIMAEAAHLMEVGVEPTSAIREAAVNHGFKWGTKELGAFVTNALKAL